MLERIIIQRTRQIRQYEPLKIEVVLLSDDSLVEKEASEALLMIDRLLYPENHQPQITTEDLQQDEVNWAAALAGRSTVDQQKARLDDIPW